MRRARPMARSRLPWHRRLVLDPGLLRSWLLLAAGSIIVTAAVGHLVAEARATTRRWGRTRPVLVTSRPVGAGQRLAVATARWPVALVPDGALARLPPGARAAGPLEAGSPVTQGMVARHDISTGRRTVAVPLGAAHLRLHRGDGVELWATGGRISEGTVVSATDRRAVVAVDQADVAAVVRAVDTSTVTLVGTG